MSCFGLANLEIVYRNHWMYEKRTLNVVFSIQRIGDGYSVGIFCEKRDVK
jgi:hypothetical protein